MQLWYGLESFARRPRFDVDAAVVRGKDADRHVKLRIQLQREVACHRREPVVARTVALVAFQALPIHLPPLHFSPANGLLRPSGLVAGKAHVGAADVLSDHSAFLVAVSRIDPHKRHPHVRLSACKPHLAHKHVLHLHAVGGKRARRLGGRHRLEVHAPAAIAVGNGRDGLMRERHRHLLARVSPAPDGDGLLALKHHVIRERHTQPDCRMQGRTRHHHRRNKRPCKLSMPYFYARDHTTPTVSGR